MGVHLVPLLAALVEEGQFEECPDVGPFAGQRDEERNVGGIIFNALPIRVEINRPRVAADDEGIRGHILPDSHPLGERVPRDLELVRAIHGLGDGRRCRGGRRWRRGRRIRKTRPGIGAFSKNLSHPQATRIGSKKKKPSIKSSRNTKGRDVSRGWRRKLRGWE